MPVRIPGSRLAGLAGAGAVSIEFGRDCLRRAVEIEFVDRSVALASLSFTALIPLGVVTGSLLPSVGRGTLSDSIVHRFRLDHDTAKLVHDVFAPPEDVRSAVSVIGIVLLLVAALSFTRALQRVYERSWRLPALGVRGTPAGIVWILGVVATLAIFSGMRAFLIDLAGPVFGVVVALAYSAVIWLLTPYILLSRRLDWQALLPTAGLTAVCITILSTVSVFYMPGAIHDSSSTYGQIGVAIALLSWLVATGFVLVGCSAVGAVISERLGQAGGQRGSEVSG